MEKSQKPALEKVAPGFDSSFYIGQFTGNDANKKPRWHFHPEFEIVYITEGTGKRHIGDHIGSYQNGELIFMAPNLPHLSYSAKSTEIVVQLKENFLGSSFFNVPELQAIKQLLERAKMGVIFENPIKHHIGDKLLSMANQSPFDRLLSLLEVLYLMATTDAYVSLQANGFSVEVNPQDQERMQRIYHYVEEHFQRNIPLEEIAQLMNMTVPAFCRYFKKLTNRTFTQLVNEFRITYASRLLKDEDMSISNICFESGFNNISHFNKQFRLITGASPREYRQKLRTIVG